MCSGIAFLFGLYLLFKGEFRIANRTISRPQSRTIALILMAPPIIAFIAALFLISGTSDITYDQLIDVTFIELGSLVIALALVAYNIAQVPPDTGKPKNEVLEKAKGAPYTPQEIPDIMTVAQAAVYMHLTERAVLDLIDQSKLGALRSGSSYRIARIAIDDYLAEQRSRQ
ncbi:MAG TPA: excisionase family DNA-binding protein [Phototrophicaceae bacterium]|nr:excisionase family DNA-binding protein [Phototrophicaceae bacterium]